MSDGDVDPPVFDRDSERLGRDIIEQNIARDVAVVRDRLSAAWTNPVIDVWLTSANAHLDGARPRDVLALDGLAGVIEAIDVEVAGGAR